MVKALCNTGGIHNLQTEVMEFYLGLGKGMDDDLNEDIDSDENSCGDDSEVSDKNGIERRIIRP